MTPLNVMAIYLPKKILLMPAKANVNISGHILELAAHDTCMPLAPECDQQLRTKCGSSHRKRAIFQSVGVTSQ